MRLMRTVLFATAAILSANTVAAEDYVMSCDEIVTKLNREATAEAKARFSDLRGSCMGVVDRDGVLYMHTKMIVRRTRGNTVTLYLPAVDRTVDVDVDPSRRVQIGGRSVRPRDLSRGQELNLYLAVEELTQPIIDEVVFDTEDDTMAAMPATTVAALPTTG